MKKIVLANGIEILAEKKNVKNFNMLIKRENSFVKITYPKQVSNLELMKFIYSKSSWIEKHAAKLNSKPIFKERLYKTGEEHYFKGLIYKLNVSYSLTRTLRINGDTMFVEIKSGDKEEHVKGVIDCFYRKELLILVEDLVEKWEPIINVSIEESRIRKMKTLWGSCNIQKRRIWLNLQLIKHSEECIEYVVVHEMVHLLERLHNARFHKLMDDFLPDWPARKSRLNQGKIW